MSASVRRRVLVASCVLGSALVLGACSSDDGSTTPNTRPTTTTTRGPEVSGVVVDLTLTGARNAVVQGTKGTCTIPQFGAASYEFSGSDYPSLGPGGRIVVKGPVTVANGGRIPANALATVTDVGFVSDREGTGITLGRDDMLVTLDAPMRGGLGGAEDINLDNPANNLMARLTGTIRCTSSED
jgi:hypothetical protein